MCCSQNIPLQTVWLQFFTYVSVHNISRTQNMLLSGNTVTDRVQFVIYGSVHNITVTQNIL